MDSIYVLLYYHDGKFLYQVERSGHDTFNIIVVIIQYDHPVECCIYYQQMTINLGEGLAVVTASFTQYTVN